MNIFVVGSCRVWRPLRPFHVAGTIVLTNHTDPNWFTHTSRGAVQFIESALGRLAIPQHLHELIVETSPRDRTIDFDGRRAISDADFILIEISSLKSFDCEGFELNQHRMRGAGIKLPMKKLGLSEVVGHLAAIEDLTGKPLAVVDHIPFDENGETISARQEITDILRASGRQFISKRDFMRPEWLDNVNHHKGEYEEEIGQHLLARLSLRSNG